MPPSARARRALGCLLAALFVPALLAATPSSSATPVAGSVPDDGVTLTTTEPLLDEPRHGAEAIQELGDRLGVAAARNDLRAGELRTLLRTDETAWVDGQGAVFYVEPARTQAEAATSATPIAPLAETFELHSNPGANLTILLDFDGATVSGTYWNSEKGISSGFQAGWDPAADGPGFTAGEQAKIQQIWATVAEDYAPFDVDVTTQDPGEAGLLRRSGDDAVYGTRVLVTPSADATQKLCGGGCAGAAYLDVFDAVGGGYQPVWVFPQHLSNDAKYIAETSSHEAGHNLGLGHDGTAPGEYDEYPEYREYYGGHGRWAPIMGAGHERSLVQWSRGSYPNASNQQDDLAIIAGSLGARADEGSDSESTPSPLPDAPAVIGSPRDTDAFLLGTCTPGQEVQIQKAAVSPNLVLRVVLIDESGLARTYRPTGSENGVSLAVPEGDGWVLEIDGAGDSDWENQGYDDYGSLGAYTVSAAGCDGASASGVPNAPVDVGAGPPVTNSVALTWSAPDFEGDGPVTGYVVKRFGPASDVRWGVAAETRSYTFTDLEPGTTYQLSVRAVNANGAGPAATVSVTTEPRTLIAPSIPRDVVGFYNGGGHALEAWWSEPADRGSHWISFYAIYLDGVYLGRRPSGDLGVGILRSDGFAEGDYTIGVRAVSDAGSSPIASVQVTVEYPEPPANDDVSDARVLKGNNGSVAGDNTLATEEGTDPPMPANYPISYGYSVWYSWTPAGTGPVAMSTSGGAPNRDTVLAVFTGEPGALVQVAGDDNEGDGFHASVGYKALAGTRYLIAVDGPGASSGHGPFRLNWSQTVVPAAPGRMVKPKAVVRGRNVTVTWTAAVATPRTQRYLVDISQGKDRSVPANVRTTVFKGLKPGAYKVRVAARNAVGTSPYSVWMRFRVR